MSWVGGAAHGVGAMEAPCSPRAAPHPSRWVQGQESVHLASPSSLGRRNSALGHHEPSALTLTPNAAPRLPLREVSCRKVNGRSSRRSPAMHRRQTTRPGQEGSPDPSSDTAQVQSDTRALQATASDPGAILPAARSHHATLPEVLNSAALSVSHFNPLANSNPLSGISTSQASSFLRARGLGPQTLSSLRSRAQALVGSHRDAMSAPAVADITLVAGAAAAALAAVVGFRVAAFMWAVAHRVVASLAGLLATPPPQLPALALGQGSSSAGDSVEHPVGPTPWWPNGAFVAAAIGATSDLLRSSSRGASLVPAWASPAGSSSAARGRGAKRVPLVVSAAAPEACFTTEGEPSAAALLSSPPISSSSSTGSGSGASTVNSGAGGSSGLIAMHLSVPATAPSARSDREPWMGGGGSMAQSGAARSASSRKSGRTPLVVSAAAPESLYDTEVEGAVDALPAGALAGQQEVKLRAVLDPDWVPVFHPPSPEEDHHVARPAHGLIGATSAVGEDEGDAAVAQAAQLAAAQMRAMDQSQQEQLAAIRRAAQMEAQILQEQHKKQLAALEAQLSAARQEAALANEIAQGLLDADVSKSRGMLAVVRGSNAAIPGSFDEAEGGEQVESLVQSFSSVLEMRLAQESARRQAAEERLREAEMLQRMLRDELEQAQKSGAPSAAR